MIGRISVILTVETECGILESNQIIIVAPF